MLAGTRMYLLILARTSAIIAAEIRMAVAQTTIVIATRWPTPLRYKSHGIHGSAMLGLDTVGILCGQRRLLSVTLPFQLRRIMHLNRPYAPVGEGVMDFFP